MFKKLSIIALFALLLACGAAFAASDEPCGEITAAQSPLWTDRDGRRIELSVGSSVYEFDVVKTGEGGSGTVSFVDGTVLEVRESSEISIMEVASSEERSRFNIGIAEGAVRAVTGEIVKRNPRGFKVSTPGATIGIRGTDLDMSYSAAAKTTGVNVRSTENEVVATDKVTGVSIAGGTGLDLSIGIDGTAVVNGIAVDLSDVQSIEAAVRSLEGIVSFTNEIGDAIGEPDAPSVGAGSGAGGMGSGSSGDSSGSGPSGSGGGSSGGDCSSDNSSPGI